MKNLKPLGLYHGITINGFNSESPLATNFTIIYKFFKNFNTKDFPMGIRFDPMEVKIKTRSFFLPTTMIENVGDKVKIFIKNDAEFHEVVNKDEHRKKALGLKVHILAETKEFSPCCLLYYAISPKKESTSNFVYSIEMEHNTLPEILKAAYRFNHEINTKVAQELPNCGTDYTSLLNPSNFPLESMIIPWRKENSYSEVGTDGIIKGYDLDYIEL